MGAGRVAGTTIEVSDIVFGTNVFGWSIHDQDDANRLLDQVVDRGVTFLDTADMYVQWWAEGVGGESETMIGSWLRQSAKRHWVTIATKVGKMLTRPGLSRENIRRACHDSLTRLGVDHIDLYYAHLDDRDTPLEESMGAFHELVEEGKVLALGASNFTATRLRQANNVAAENSLTPFVALQNHYNLVTRHDYETDSVPVIEELGLAAFPYFGLASGFLTGKYQPGTTADSVRTERVASTYITDDNLAVVRNVIAVSQRHGVEPASVAIEWLRRQPGVTAPIVSARNAEQLDHLLVRVPLTDDDLTILGSPSGQT